MPFSFDAQLQHDHYAAYIFGAQGCCGGGVKVVKSCSYGVRPIHAFRDSFAVMMQSLGPKHR